VAAGIVAAPTLLIVGGAYLMVNTAGKVISSALKKDKNR